MFKPDMNGIVRVEGAEAIAKAHLSSDLIEIGGNSRQGWAEFKVKNFSPKLVSEEKPKKRLKKEAKKDD